MLARTLLLPTALLTTLALSACGDPRPDWVDEPLDVTGPLALSHGLYYLERSRGEVLAVDVLAESASDLVRRIDVGDGPKEALVVPSTDPVSPPTALAIVTPKDRALHLLVEDATTGELSHRTLALEQAYDRLAFSHDGAYGVAWMGPAAEQVDFASQPGKIAVIRMAGALAGEEGALVERSLNVEEAPTRVVFSRPLSMPDVSVDPLTLAAVVTAERIALVDLDRPDLRARTVFLDPGVHPLRMRFTDGVASDASAEFLLFNADGDAGISAFRILADPAYDPDELEPRLRLTYHQLLPDDRPADFEVFPDPSGTRQLVISVGAGTNRATVMELQSTPVGTTVDLPGGVANRILRTTTATGEELAVLYDDSGRGRHLQYLPIETAAADRPEVRSGEAFVAPVLEVQTVAQHPGMAFVFLRNTSQVELVDLETTRSTPVRLRSRPVQMVWDRRGSELFLVASDNREEGNLLVRIRLSGSELVSEALPLNSSPASVHLLVAKGVAVVDHGRSHGMLTAVPIDSLERPSARVIEGVFVAGLLDAAGGRDDR